MAKFRVGDEVKDRIDGDEGVVSEVLGYFCEDDLLWEDVDTLWWAKSAGVYYDVEIQGETNVVWEGRLVGRLPDKDCYHPATQPLDEILRSVRETEHV